MKNVPVEKCATELLATWHERARQDRTMWANHILRLRAVVERAMIRASAREEAERDAQRRRA